MSFEFYCAFCEDTHVGMPSFESDRPQAFHSLPEEERESRAFSDTDGWIIDHHYFVRGYLDLPVDGAAEPLMWLVWVQVSEQDYLQWRNSRSLSIRDHIGPFYGYLDSPLTGFENTLGLRVCLHLKNGPQFPWAELEPTEHPLSVAQHKGISVERVAELYTAVKHRLDAEQETTSG